MKPAVVTCAFDSWYSRGAARLYQSLNAQGFVGGRLWYVNELPPGAPAHSTHPYVFKLHALQAAFDADYDTVIWADASMYAISRVEPVFKHIDKHGYILFESPHNCAEWCHDALLAHFKVTRDAAEKIPQVIGGLCGFSKKHMLGWQMYADWLELAKTAPGLFRGKHDNEDRSNSRDPRCKGHRHDQSVLSMIAHSYEVKLIKAPHLYTWDADNPASDTVFVNRGM